MVSRRQFFTIANGAALAPLAAGLAPAPLSAEPLPPTMQLKDYYAFLWLEMENVEKRLGIERLSARTLEAGRDAAEQFIEATEMRHRIDRLTGNAVAAAA